jgi:hypothetical protein
MSITYALDLDEELLAHLPSQESWLVLTAEGFGPELIEDHEIRDIYCYTVAYNHDHKQLPSATVLGDEFDLNLREPETAIGDLIDRMRVRFVKNQGRDKLRDIIARQKEDPLALATLLLQGGRELSGLLTKRGEMFGSEDVSRATNRYNKKVLAGPGASVGFAELDDYFFGMRGVTLWIAPPKTMKSWIMCQGVLSNARAGANPWLYSLELPAEEADMRLRCLMADVPWWHYIRNRITDEEWQAIHAATEELHEQGCYRVVKPRAGHRGIEELVQTARDNGAGVVFIDQLQYVENTKGQSIGSLNNTGEYWDVLNKARDLSDDGPICFAHQFNRSAMFADSMPAVEQAKGSSSIEEVATLALGMWANKHMRKSRCVSVGTLIARNHEYAAWEMSVELSRGCRFEITGRVDDDDDL